MCASVIWVFLITFKSARLSPTPTRRMFQFFSAEGMGARGDMGAGLWLEGRGRHTEGQLDVARLERRAGAVDSKLARKRGQIFDEIIRDILQHLPTCVAHREMLTQIATRQCGRAQAHLLGFRLEFHLGVDGMCEFLQPGRRKVVAAVRHGRRRATARVRSRASHAHASTFE